MDRSAHILVLLLLFVDPAYFSTGIALYIGLLKKEHLEFAEQVLTGQMPLLASNL